MLELPAAGLYRTTQALPGHEDAFPSGVLVFVGQSDNGAGRFVVRPGQNRRNRWYWGEPTTPLRSPSWGQTLKALPSEGFYNLPEDLFFSNGGRWVKNAIVQLGYNGFGQGIVFVAEWQDDGTENLLRFSDKGMLIDDDLLSRLSWAPILPKKGEALPQPANTVFTQ
jgi:hypothetical protein